VVSSLVSEYRACETEGYANWSAESGEASQGPRRE